MPKSSNRGSNLSQSPIRELVPYARKAESEGKEIFYLNIGQPDIETPEEALAAVKNIDETVIKYGPSEGYLELRKTFADYYSKFEIDIDASDVYVTTGASEAILFALFSCFDEGDEIILPEPFYANYIGFTQMSGVKIVPLTCTIEEEFGLPQTSAFEQLITPRTKAIFLCNPSNPTGTLYSKKELEHLSAIVKKHDLFLVVDEVYREFCYEEPFYSVLNLQEISDHTIVIDSISKVFSSCGARIGFMVTRNKEVKSVVEKYAQQRLCPPMMGQYLAMACYKNRETYIHTVRDEYDKRRNYIFQRLQKIKGVKCYKPKAAFYNIVELPVSNAKDFCKWMLSDFSHEGRTLMMAPANGFYSSSSLGLNQVRIAYVLSVDKLEKAMDCLEQGLLEYGNTTPS